MASTTKIMTCIVALEETKENMACTASEQAAHQPQVKLGMQTGETFYLKDLLYSLMLGSHNAYGGLYRGKCGRERRRFCRENECEGPGDRL